MTTKKIIKKINDRLAVQGLGIKISNRTSFDSIDDGINLTLTNRSTRESLQLPANIPTINTFGIML